MPQIGGKPKVSKATKTPKKKSSSSTKRNFTVVIGSKEHGIYVSSSPSSAARKAVSKLCATDKKRKVQFHIREITQKSDKKTYGPYLGYIEKLAKPIELKGRIIRYKPVAKLVRKTGKKTAVKKGGMWGGAVGDNGQNLVKDDFFAFETQEANPNLDLNNRMKIKTSYILQEPYIFFGIPFTLIHSENPPYNYYYKYVIFKTFPKREIKVMKMELRYMEEGTNVKEHFKEISTDIRSSTEMLIPFTKLKEDIDQYRISIENPSFCSNIYTFIKSVLEAISY